MSSVVTWIVVLGTLAFIGVVFRLRLANDAYHYSGESGLKESTGPIDKGDKHGLWKFWHANGQLSAEGRFDHGEKMGRWIYYHENGEKFAAGQYHGSPGSPTEAADALAVIMGNAPCGRWGYWHPNGAKWAAGEFSLAGRPVGVWQFWDNSGAEVDGEPEQLRIP